MKKLIPILILSILSMIVLSGCWDYEEYESMARIIAVGADYNVETHETTVTLQYISNEEPKGSGTGSSMPLPGYKGNVYSATDKTFYGAVSKLQQVIMKKLFYGYVKIFVIGEAAAKYNIVDLIEFIDRTPAVRNSIYIAITSGKAANVISTVDPSQSTSTSEQMYNLINESGSTGSAYPVTIQEFMEMLAIGGLDATAPRIISTAKTSEEPTATSGIQGRVRFNEEIKGALRASGNAAFKEGKFIGWLDDKESMGFGWITGKNILGYKYSEISDEDNTAGILYYRINKSKSKIKVELKNNMPVIYVNIRVVADLRKYYSNKGSEFLNPKEIRNMEKKLSASIQTDVEAALLKGQKEFKSDIFGFGFEFFRKYPKLWKTKYEKKWPDIFSDVPVHVNVDSKVINTGTNIKKLIIK